MSKLGSFFSRTIEVIEGTGHSAHTFLVKVFGADAVQAAENDISALMHEDVLKIFQDAITAAETLQVDGTAAAGDQKRSAAFDQIVKDLAADGKQFATHTINLGIELVVGLLRAKQSTAVAAVTAPAAEPSPAPVAQ
jgi:hypothetical protein